MPYTPASSGLVERAHQTIADAVRTALIHTKLQAKYWYYTVQHVVDCNNFVCGSPRRPSSYKQAFVCNAQGLRHLRPLGCRTPYRPNKPRLITFDDRAADSLCLGHIDSGLYHVLTEDGKVVKTKQIKMFEEQFPDMDLFKKSTIVNESPEEVQFDDEDEKNQDTGEQHAPVLNQEALTYVSKVPNTFGGEC